MLTFRVSSPVFFKTTSILRALMSTAAGGPKILINPRINDISGTEPTDNIEHKPRSGRCYHGRDQNNGDSTLHSDIESR